MTDRAAFDRAWAAGRCRPVWRDVIADFDTPLSAFSKTTRGSHAFLLDSVEGGEIWGRYSFFGSEPWAWLEHTAGRAHLTLRDEPDADVSWLPADVDPLGAIERVMEQTPVELPEDAPRFVGGAIGYLGYDAIRYYEKVELTPAANEPDAVFVFPEWFAVYDRLRSTLRIVALPIRRRADGKGAFGSADAAWSWAQSQLDEIVERLGATTATPAVRGGSIHSRGFEPDAETFQAAVERAREYIQAGDIIQVVLSRRTTLRHDLDPFEVYRGLRLVNPSPYMFYLRVGERTLVGSSPEALVRVEAGRVMTRPIAGTRPRAADPATDAARAQELLADPKERAEHLMLVDLGRNDIGRVAKVGSVTVSSFMRIERYSHVMHIVSDVEGELAAGKSAFDAVASCFPAGTLSGAPKVRAMEIIAELEPTARGVYGGAVGYFSFDGNADTCIAIRTLEFVGDDTVRVQAGAGIVYDSSPVAETEETEAKAEAMLATLRRIASGTLS